MSNKQVVAARAATAGSEHGAVGGAVGLGSVRHTPEKEGPQPPILPTSGGRALGRRSYCRRSRRVSTVPRTSSS